MGLWILSSKSVGNGGGGELARVSRPLAIAAPGVKYE